MEEPSFVVLRDAISTGDYQQAFDAAHALKGLSGNLGVTAFYNAIRALTESLRSKIYDDIEEEYAQVEEQHSLLSRLLLDEPQMSVPAAVQPGLPAKEAKDTGKVSAEQNAKNGRFLARLLSASIVAVLFIGLLFYRINVIHSQNVVDESGQHLTEMSNQHKFLSAKAGTYDVIYMDIQMPTMDGYEATARIRASDHPQAKTIPVVAMTANAFAEDIEKARVAGMDAYVDKPIVSFNLVEQTTKALRKKKEPPA